MVRRVVPCEPAATRHASMRIERSREAYMSHAMYLFSPAAPWRSEARRETSAAQARRSRARLPAREKIVHRCRLRPGKKTFLRFCAAFYYGTASHSGEGCSWRVAARCFAWGRPRASAGFFRSPRITWISRKSGTSASPPPPQSITVTTGGRPPPVPPTRRHFCICAERNGRGSRRTCW